MKKSYIVAIDYRATYKPMTTDYKVLEADNLLDAMSEAESYLDTEKVYLLIIMQADKAGHKVKGMPGIRENTYIEQITNRGNGWHRTDAAPQRNRLEPYHVGGRKQERPAHRQQRSCLKPI